VSIYLVTLAGVLLAQIAPGPNLLAVAGAALGQGLRAATFVSLGVATAIFVWVTVTTFGLATLLVIYPPLLIAMKIIGGGYLIFLAAKAFRSALQGKDSSFQAARAPWSPLSAWRRGLLVNLTNPKSALMWGAITTFMFGSGLSTLQVLGFAPIGFASALVVYGTYGVLFSTSLAKGVYARFTRSIELLFGAAFGALGSSLIADGVRDIGSRSA
jgi:threonine/homoserine/homoserine lactone efflux protein